MRVSQLDIKNFRGIRQASLLFSEHAVLIGDNNTGKSTILEALDLVLGPDRLNRRPPVDEHDFFLGRYLSPAQVADCAPTGGPEESAANHYVQAPKDQAESVDETVPEGSVGLQEEQMLPKIEIEATIAGLTEEQQARFRDYIEWWDEEQEALYDVPDVKGVDGPAKTPALRVTFIGHYDPEDDDFTGDTFFTRSLTEGEPQRFRKSDKQRCGFLYLRSLRTGSRALSLERGSLLDIILRIKELRPQMWEATLGSLISFDVAADPAIGISGVLESINAAIKKYVPREWGAQPHLRVSALTREHLRKIVTAFIPTGEGDHSAPYYRQGTGTINMLVLAMLSQIAEDKQNVIFAMEEPETAIPPYAQKRIVHEVRKLSAQSIFTSHSPYVLEEFRLDETAILCRSGDGHLDQFSITLPDSVKHKRYRQEFRTRFCEGLLARRLLITEGATETAAIPVVARRLAELNPARYCSLEALGICVVDAATETQIAELATLYSSLGKRVFAICDKQTHESKAKIEASVERLFMHQEKGFEVLVLKNTTDQALSRFAGLLDWPPHLSAKYPDLKADVRNALSAYFGWSKGNWGIADFLAQCVEDEVPEWIRNTCLELAALTGTGPEAEKARAGAEAVPEVVHVA